MEYASFLRHHIESIVGLTDDEFLIIQKYFRPRTVLRKEFLIQGGDVVHAEFLVVKGLMKAYCEDDDVKEHIIQFAMEGWWISDYPAFARQQSGEICVQALEDSIVLELSFTDKAEMCKRVPRMYEFHGRKSFGGYVALQQRVLSLLRNSAKEKYELLLGQYPQLFQRVPKTLIAHYLGVSRETLSRLEKK